MEIYLIVAVVAVLSVITIIYFSKADDSNTAVKKFDVYSDEKLEQMLMSGSNMNDQALADTKTNTLISFYRIKIDNSSDTPCLSSEFGDECMNVKFDSSTSLSRAVLITANIVQASFNSVEYFERNGTLI